MSRRGGAARAARAGDHSEIWLGLGLGLGLGVGVGLGLGLRLGLALTLTLTLTLTWRSVSQPGTSVVAGGKGMTTSLPGWKKGPELG